MNNIEYLIGAYALIWLVLAYYFYTSGAKLKQLEEKVKMRGARVIESFAIATKDKTNEKLINDTEVIIEMKDLKMYTR